VADDMADRLRAIAADFDAIGDVMNVYQLRDAA
jgi:hypothetical protein